MRKGKFFFPKTSLSIVESTPFIGMQIAVSAVSFLLVSIVVGLIFTVLVHPLLWQYLWENIVIILIAIGMNIVNMIIQMTVLKYLMDPFKGVKHRRLNFFFEFFFYFFKLKTFCDI